VDLFPGSRLASQRRLLSRRRLLQAGAVTGLAAAAGCSVSDPRIEGANASSTAVSGSPSNPAANGASPSATPIPTPAVPGAQSGAQAEAATAALASALLASKAKLTSDQRRVVTAARDAHLLHAAVLRTPDPTARSTAGASAAPTPSKPAKVSLAALIAAEKSLAARHAKLIPTSRGLTALLFGSLSVAATTYASALAAKGKVPIRKTPANPATPEVLDDVAGLQAVVGQLHALIYGYQVAAGKLSVGSKARDRALSGLTERRALRDRLISLLIARKASVPAAEAAYVTRASGRASAAALIAGMETAFVPFTGQWLAAAAHPADQQLAWASMRRAASLSRTWGGPVSAWPGWPA
jgi:hypothetical protein